MFWIFDGQLREIFGQDRNRVSFWKRRTLGTANFGVYLYRHDEFLRQYPTGKIKKSAFRRLCTSILDPSEVEKFTKEVFDMFDSDMNDLLTFEEFILATEVHDVDDNNPLGKLAWLYDNVYDEVSNKTINFIEFRE